MFEAHSSGWGRGWWMDTISVWNEMDEMSYEACMIQVHIEIIEYLCTTNGLKCKLFPMDGW